MSIDAKAIETRTEAVAGPILENLGYSLVASEFTFEEGRWLLRLFIEKDGGITIDDCVRASHGVEDVIAVEDFVPVGYSLEVSSPGLNRLLKRREDFERFVGERVKLRTTEPIEGRSHFKGILTGLGAGSIELAIDGTKFQVPLDKIDRARLVPEESKQKAGTH